MPISERDYKYLELAIANGWLQGEDVREADQLMSEYEELQKQPGLVKRAGKALLSAGSEGADRFGEDRGTPPAPEVAADQARIGRGTLRAPLTGVEGLGQLAIASGNALPGVDLDAHAKEYDAAVTEQRKGLDPLEIASSELVAELPFGVNPGGIVRRGAPFFGRVHKNRQLFPEQPMGPFKPTTATGAVISNTAMGGLGSASHFEAGADASDKGIAALIGGGASGAVSALLSLRTAGQNVITNLVDGARQQNPELVKLVAQSEEAVPGGFTISQMTGIPYLRTLEAKAFNTQAVVRYADQSRNVVLNYAREMLGVLNEKDTAIRIARVKGLAEADVDKLMTNQTNAWLSGIADAEKAVGDSRVRIGAANMRDALQAVIGGKPNGTGQNVIALRPESSPLAHVAAEHSGVRELVTRIGATIQRDGGLTVRDYGESLKLIEQLNRTLQDISATGKIGFSDSQRALVIRTLRDAADADAKKVYEMAGGLAEARPLARGIDKLLETRGRYLQDEHLIAAMQDDAVRRIFGPGGPTSREGMFDAFLDMTPNAQKTAMSFVDEHVPELAVAFRNESVSRAMKLSAGKGRLNQPGADAMYDMYAFQKALLDPKVTPPHLFTGAQLDQINKTVDALRVVNNHRPELRGAGTPVVGEDIAPNIVSRSPIFVGRQLTRLLEGSEHASRVLLDPAVYKRLLVIKNTVGPAQIAARLGLAQYLHDFYPVSPYPEIIFPDEQPAGAEQEE